MSGVTALGRPDNPTAHRAFGAGCERVVEVRKALGVRVAVGQEMRKGGVMHPREAANLLRHACPFPRAYEPVFVAPWYAKATAQRSPHRSTHDVTKSVVGPPARLAAIALPENR